MKVDCEMSDLTFHVSYHTKCDFPVRSCKAHNLFSLGNKLDSLCYFVEGSVTVQTKVCTILLGSLIVGFLETEKLPIKP